MKPEPFVYRDGGGNEIKDFYVLKVRVVREANLHTHLQCLKMAIEELKIIGKHQCDEFPHCDNIICDSEFTKDRIATLESELAELEKGNG